MSDRISNPMFNTIAPGSYEYVNPTAVPSRVATRVLKLQVRHPHVLMLVCDDVSSACVDVETMSRGACVRVTQ